MIRTMTSRKKMRSQKWSFKRTKKKTEKKMLGHLFKTQFTVKLIYFEDPRCIYTRK